MITHPSVNGRELTISFAVTAYNEMTRGGPTISHCIRAAVEHPAIDEIVIVDDGSDDYPDLVDMLSCTPKVKLFKNAKNLGVFGNKVAAVANSTGDWVINSDSDNVLSQGSIDAVLSCSLDPMTWYCPSFARPNFDYRQYVGSYDSGSVSALIGQGGLANCFVNTGNQTVHRQRYLDVFAQYLNQRADLMMPNHLSVSESERSGQHWRDVFNACDSLILNSEWLKNGGTLEIVGGFEYDHYWTGGSDSNYNRAPAEKSRLNDILLANLSALR